MDDNKIPEATQPPLNGPAVQRLHQALEASPSGHILLIINNMKYRLNREGHWFRLSRLSKKCAIKRSRITYSLSDVYNQFLHGYSWKIASF